MAINVTKTELGLNTLKNLVEVDATSTVADMAEVFEFEFKGVQDEKAILILDNTTAGQGAVTYSIASGDYWAKGTALTGSVAEGSKGILRIEGGKYKGFNGKVAVTVAPASGKRLLTDHAFRAGFVVLPK